jgi:hypothetical protein
MVPFSATKTGDSTRTNAGRTTARSKIGRTDNGQGGPKRESSRCRMANRDGRITFSKFLWTGKEHCTTEPSIVDFMPIASDLHTPTILSCRNHVKYSIIEGDDPN